MPNYLLMGAKLRRIMLLTAIIITAISRAMSQTSENIATDLLDFVKYTAHEGLSNSHINAIGQDKYGFIWIATDNGLNRLDGLNIETFHYSESDSTTVNANMVFTIYTDRDNGIWFGTFSGLCRYDYEKGEFVTYTLPPQANAIKYVPVRGITQTDGGYLWLATSGGGLARMSTATGEVTYMRHDDNNPTSIASDYLHTIVQDNDGNLWIGSENNGLSIYNPKTQQCTNINKASGNLGSNIIHTLFKSSDGRIWIGTYEGGLSIYDPKTNTFELHRLSNEGTSIYGIAESTDGKVWVGTQEKGLFIFDGDNIKRYANAIGNTSNLISDNIHALYTDNNGNIWLGIFQGGVCMVKPTPLFGGIGHREATASGSISHKPVLSIFPDNKERVYIGTDGDGINIWNTVTNHVEHIRAGERGLKSNIIRSIYKDHDGRIWMGTYLKGLQEYNPVKNTFTGYENNPDDSTSLSHNDVTCITEDRLGNFWIGTNGGGLNLFDKKTGKFKRFTRSADKNPNSNHIINNHITNLYIDHLGYLWICTFWGLSRMDPAKGTIRNFQLNDRHNTYFCLLEDNKQRFWAGTANGLRLMDINNGTFQTFSTNDGLPNNVINGIAEDSHGNLWLSTDQGICKFNYDTKSAINYYTEDGLMSNEFIHNSMAMADDGEIFFGSVEGVTKFYPDLISIENTPPLITISDLLVFNKKIKPGDSSNILQKSITETDAISLQWQDNSFTIVYKAIDFVQPQKIKYASRMVGFDKEWQYYNYNQTSASYTNLNAGIYHFEVKASTDGKTWSDPVVLTVKIIAPIWKRWWAIALYILAIIAAIDLFWRYYRRTEQEKQKIKIEYIKQQNDIELNKTRLQLFTNISHEIRTPLTLLISPLEQMMESGKYDGETQTHLGLMHRNAQRLLRLVNQVMDIRKIDNGKLQFAPVKGDIVNFAREICENFQQLATGNSIALSFSSELETYRSYFDPEILDKALYNLIANAFKFTPVNGKVEVSVQRAEDGKAAIIIKDNGRGIAPENIGKIFDRFFQGDTSNIQQGTGIGLWLTKQYIEMHKGAIEVSSELGKGTTFTITLTDGEEFKDTNKDTSSYQHLSAASYFDRDKLPQAATAADNTGDSKPAASRHTLLVIEDNADIRQYLRDQLSKDYIVKTATDGDEGLQLARTTLPDLVITDITMPHMSGTDLCRTLKTDIETCHIPVIMLTAKSSELQRIEGLENGADSYITKPFNPRHLLVRIEKLLELRKTLRDKFMNEIGFEAVQTAVTTTDRDLLKKVTDTIRKRISDTSLSVETLAEDVGLSRGHLQRKLKNLTGQNPNEFIRTIRLKFAADLLAEKQELSIAEIAEMAGFNSQSYFSTAFTKQFNISPSQYKDEPTSR